MFNKVFNVTINSQCTNYAAIRMHRIIFFSESQEIFMIMSGGRILIIVNTETHTKRERNLLFICLRDLHTFTFNFI